MKRLVIKTLVVTSLLCPMLGNATSPVEVVKEVAQEAAKKAAENVTKENFSKAGSALGQAVKNTGSGLWGACCGVYNALPTLNSVSSFALRTAQSAEEISQTLKAHPCFATLVVGTTGFTLYKMGVLTLPYRMLCRKSQRVQDMHNKIAGKFAELQLLVAQLAAAKVPVA